MVISRMIKFVVSLCVFFGLSWTITAQMQVEEQQEYVQFSTLQIESIKDNKVINNRGKQIELKLDPSYGEFLENYQLVPVSIKKNSTVIDSMSSPLSPFRNSLDEGSPTDIELAKLIDEIEINYNSLSHLAKVDSNLNEVTNKFKRVGFLAYDRILNSKDDIELQRNIALFAKSQQTADAIQSELKNYNGVIDRVPDFYAKVAGHSNAIARISVPHPTSGNKNIYGTGFLVKENLLLTARHNIERYVNSPGEIIVRFGYEHDSRDEPMNSSYSCNTNKVQVSENNDLDLALLSLDCDINNEKDRYVQKVLELSKLNPQPNMPIYTVSHPGGENKIVSDNGEIRFPYYVKDTSYYALHKTYCKNQYNETIETQVCLKFKEYYKKGDNGDYFYTTPGLRWDQNRSSVIQFAENVPVVGFYLNTKKGSSGAPVMSGKSHKVIGLYFAGRADVENTTGVEFFRHEAAIPSTEVLKWLSDIGIEL